MEELKQLCEFGAATISISKQWEELDRAMKLLASYGYVEQESIDELDLNEDMYILFHLASQVSNPLEQVQQKETIFSFPSEVPAPQYKSVSQRAGDPERLSDWTPFIAFQHDSRALPDYQQLRITARTPKLSQLQTVGVKMVIQPIVLLDSAHFNVKLRVEKLVVGIHKNEFITGDRQGLGYYPYFVRVDIEPQVDNDNDLCAIPTLDPPVNLPHMQSSLPSVVKKCSTTSVAAQLGYGPASLTLAHAWGTEREDLEFKPKVQVVQVDDADGGNTASFEWKILRWDNKQRYRADKPHSGVRNGKPVQLPFRGCAASLESGIPDILWKLPREVAGGDVRFRIRLQIEMHLVWFFGNVFSRCVGSSAGSFKYENIWRLQQGGI